MAVRRGIRHPNPSYVWRPDQLIRRVSRGHDEQLIRLHWGAPIRLDPSQKQEKGILRIGTHELPVTEMIWRLTAPDDLALDVGANIGYFSSLLSRRASSVLAFEPHPVMAERLRENAARWPGVEVYELAASAQAGTTQLFEAENFEVHSGTSSLEDGAAGSKSHQIETVRLDDVVKDRRVGMLKIDVEGHELSALTGLEKALSEGRVRDLLFEDHDPIPSRLSSFLTDHGFEIFTLRQRVRGLQLGPPTDPPQDWYAWAGPTYLATTAPERAREKAKSLGWRCLVPR